MRFADLSQEVTQCFWNRWKHIIRETLHEFNMDVFHRKGIVRENSYWERTYILLETKQACLYVFPLPGNILMLKLYCGKIEKEYLSLKCLDHKIDQENLIGWVGVNVGIIEERYDAVEVKFQSYLELVLRAIYKKHWARSIL